MLEGKSEALPDDLIAGLLKVKHIIKGDSQEHTYIFYTNSITPDSFL